MCRIAAIQLPCILPVVPTFLLPRTPIPLPERERTNLWKTKCPTCFVRVRLTAPARGRPPLSPEPVPQIGIDCTEFPVGKWRRMKKNPHGLWWGNCPSCGHRLVVKQPLDFAPSVTVKPVSVRLGLKPSRRRTPRLETIPNTAVISSVHNQLPLL